MGVGRDGYLYKPAGENSGRGLAILPPNLSGQVASVAIVDGQGNVLDEGRYRHPYETGGSIFDFNYTGGTYGTETKLRVTLDDGRVVYFGGGNGRDEGGIIGQEGGSSQTAGGNFPQTAQTDAYGNPVASSSASGGNPLMQAATGLGGLYVADQYGKPLLNAGKDLVFGAIKDAPNALSQAVDYGKNALNQAVDYGTSLFAPSAEAATAGMNLAASTPFSFGTQALGQGAMDLGAAVPFGVQGATDAAALGTNGALDLASTVPFGVEGGANLAATAAPSAFAQVAGPAAAVYGGYTLGQNLMDNKKDAMGGAMSGAALGGGLALAGLTGGLSIPLSLLTGGAVGGALGGLIGGGPNPRQIQRREVRNKLRATPLANDQFKKHGLGFIGVGNKPIEIGDHAVDMKNPLAGQAIAYMDPIAEFLTGGNTSKREDVGAMFGNALLQGATTPGELRANALKLVNTLGIKYNDIMGGLESLKANGTLDDDRYNIYLHNMGLLKEGSKPPADAVVPGIGGVPALPNGVKPKDNSVAPKGANMARGVNPMNTTVPVSSIAPKTVAQYLPGPKGNGSSVAANMLNKNVYRPRGNGSSMVGNMTDNRFSKK